MTNHLKIQRIICSCTNACFLRDTGGFCELYKLQVRTSAAPCSTVLGIAGFSSLHNSELCVRASPYVSIFQVSSSVSLVELKVKRLQTLVGGDTGSHVMECGPRKRSVNLG